MFTNVTKVFLLICEASHSHSHSPTPTNSHSHSHLILDPGSAYPLQRHRSMQIQDPGSGGCGCGCGCGCGWVGLGWASSLHGPLANGEWQDVSRGYGGGLGGGYQECMSMCIWVWACVYGL